MKDFDLSDTQSPREILEVAKEDWYKGSEGVMELVLQDAETQSGNLMIIVHTKYIPSNRTLRLFSVTHPLNNYYPVLIQPETESRNQAVSDLWVSDNASEFRENLKTFLIKWVKNDDGELIPLMYNG